jgi:ubiquitin C-terminal hydrolase
MTLITTQCAWCLGRFTHFSLIQNVDIWVCDICSTKWRKSPLFGVDGVTIAEASDD